MSSGGAKEAQRGWRHRGPRRQVGIRRDVDRGSALGSNRHVASFETDDDRAVAIGAQDPRARRGEPIEGRLGRVAIGIAGTSRCHGHLRPGGLDERFGGRGLAPVMRHLEQVDLRQALGQERWIDALLDVAHQEHPSRADVAQQHDRDVVDGRAAIRRLERNLTADRPEDAEADLIDGRVDPRRPGPAGPARPRH